MSQLRRVVAECKELNIESRGTFNSGISNRTHYYLIVDRMAVEVQSKYLHLILILIHKIIDKHFWIIHKHIGENKNQLWVSAFQILREIQFVG